VNPTFDAEVTFTTWREDIYDENYELVKQQPLMLRATLPLALAEPQWIDFHMVVWEETDEEIEDCKELLMLQVRRTYEDAIMGRG
jgi:hypothetical protein